MKYIGTKSINMSDIMVYLAMISTTIDKNHMFLGPHKLCTFILCIYNESRSSTTPGTGQQACGGCGGMMCVGVGWCKPILIFSLAQKRLKPIMCAGVVF